MKLKYKNQDFQTDAVNAVVDLFAGQEKTHSTFSVEDGAAVSLFHDLGVGNALRLDIAAVQQNMHAVQKRNYLPLTELTSNKEQVTASNKTVGYSRKLRTWPDYGTASGVQWSHQEQGSNQDDPQRVTHDTEAAQRIPVETNHPSNH